MTIENIEPYDGKLAACSWCHDGGRPEVMTTVFTTSESEGRYAWYVTCFECDTMTPACESEREAAEVWSLIVDALAGLGRGDAT